MTAKKTSSNKKILTLDERLALFDRKKHGGEILIDDNPWKPLLKSLSKSSDDFMTSRNQPKQQKRKRQDNNK